MEGSQGLVGTLVTRVPTSRASSYRAQTSSRRSCVPTHGPMRTLGFRTHALLTIAAAVGVIAALAQPWYAAAPRAAADASGTVGTIDGPVDGLAAGMQRWISETAGVTGWDGLGTWGTVLAAMAALTAVGALGCMIPAVQGVAREALRYSALAAFGIALWKLIDTPGPNQVMEP